MRLEKKPALLPAEMSLLMRYADGDVDAEEEKRAVRLLAEKADAHEYVRQVFVLGDLVREGAATRADGFDVTGSVLARIAHEDSHEQPPGAKGEPNSASEPRPRGTILNFPRPLRWGLGGAVALAAAAAISLFVDRPKDNAPVAATPAASDSAGVSLDQVDSPSSVSVFYLPAAVNANASSVVVWIDDDAKDTVQDVAPSAAPSQGQAPAPANEEKKR